MIDLFTMTPPALWATVAALGARNGVEDLHSEGLLEDGDMPTLNRSLRNGLFDAFAIVGAVSDGHPRADEMFIWLSDLIDIDETDDPVHAVVPPTVEDAIDHTITACNLDEGARAPLSAAAAAGALEYLGYLFGGQARQQELWFVSASIPDYWEPPEHSPEVAALLDVDPTP